MTFQKKIIHVRGVSTFLFITTIAAFYVLTIYICIVLKD